MTMNPQGAHYTLMGIETLSLRTFFFTPSIALKLADNVSIGVSVSLVPATVYLKNTLGATDNLQPLFPSTMWGSEGRIELSGSGFGVGANAGISRHPAGPTPRDSGVRRNDGLSPE